MFVRCELRECSRIFDDGGQPVFFCSPTHRDEAHRLLKRMPCSDEPTPAFSTSPTLAPRRRTVSVGEGYQALANQALSPEESARRNDERAAQMIAKLALMPRSR